MIHYVKYSLTLKRGCDMFAICEIKINGTKVTHHSSTTYRWSFKDAAHMFVGTGAQTPTKCFFLKKGSRSQEECKHLDAHIRQIKHLQINMWKPLCKQGWKPQTQMCIMRLINATPGKKNIQSVQQFALIWQDRWTDCFQTQQEAFINLLCFAFKRVGLFRNNLVWLGGGVLVSVCTGWFCFLSPRYRGVKKCWRM